MPLVSLYMCFPSDQQLEEAEPVAFEISHREHEDLEHYERITIPLTAASQVEEEATLGYIRPVKPKEIEETEEQAFIRQKAQVRKIVRSMKKWADLLHGLPHLVLALSEGSQKTGPPRFSHIGKPRWILDRMFMVCGDHVTSLVTCPVCQPILNWVPG